VWENLGWHFALRARGLSLYEEVYPGQKPTYTCLLSAEADGPGGAAHWTELGQRFTNPNTAVASQMNKAQNFVDYVTRAVAQTKRVLGMKP
jgi:hypothetical protein